MTAKIQNLEAQLVRLEQRTSIQESRSNASETAYNTLTEGTRARMEQLGMAMEIKHTDIRQEPQDLNLKLDSWFMESQKRFQKIGRTVNLAWN